MADEEGNACIHGPRWDNVDQVEGQPNVRSSSPKKWYRPMIAGIRTDGIPGLLVSHVVESPFAAHPTSVYRCYDYDGEQIESYVRATRTPEA